MNRFDNLCYTDSKDFAKIYGYLTDSSTIDIDAVPIMRYYVLMGNKLYYKLYAGTLALCIPEGHHTVSLGLKKKVPLREAIVRECHDSPYMGHRGVNKTYLMIRKLFYWKNYLNSYTRMCAHASRARALSLVADNVFLFHQTSAL